MHPILGNLQRLAAYLLAWIPLTAVFAGLLMYSGGLSWQSSFALAVPLCVIYAFDCLGTWYLCKVTPPQSTGFTRLITTHGLAASAISGLWALIAYGLSDLYATFVVSFGGLQQQIIPSLPLIFATGFLLYLLSVGLHYVLLSMEHSRQAEEREAKAHLLARDSELKALKAQVNPHFLFNSLNSISALTSVDAARAREMCILLADFLRATLGLGEKAQIPVSEELSLIRSFLAVEKVRFGPRLKVQEFVDESSSDCLVPPLLLQPLVENAVNHGVANLLEGGWIKLEIKTNGGGSLDLIVENNFDRESPPRKGTGTGLKNVRQRLSARYGERAQMKLDNSTEVFRVEITLPAEKGASV